MTYREGQEYFANESATMKQQADKIAAAKQEDDIHALQTQAVHDHFLEQLNTANRFPEHVNQSYAAMMRDFYTVNADKLGITPTEMQEKYPLEERADALTGTHTLDQTHYSESMLSDVPISQQPYSVRYLLRGEIKRMRAESWQNPRPGQDPERADERLTGEQLVDRIAQRLGSKEQAHEYLQSLGIADVKPSDMAGKRMPFPSIMFQKARGQISFGDDITQQPSIITLLKSADLSTFLHETVHFFLEVGHDMARNPDAPEPVRKDMDTRLHWFGIDGSPEQSALDRWGAMSLEDKRPFHEQFARGFEAYLMEGKAPNVELASLFARFRSWLVNVYKSLSNLNVTLTPEVRGVMDRLLASDESIKQAEQVRGYQPLFESAQAAGMTPEQFSDYQKVGATATQDAISEMDARSLKDMQWLSNAKSKAIKALQKEAAGKRKAVQDEATKAVMAEPVNQARTWLRKGEMSNERGETVKAEKGFRLDSAALKEMYPEGMLGRPDLEGLKGMTGKNGLHPDLAAEMFGFESGGDLVNALLHAEPAKDAIARMTDQLMLEHHGELATPDAIARAAEAAIHNEARAKFIATELKALADANTVREQVGTNRKGHKVTIDLLAKAAKEAAQASLAAKRIRDLRPLQYSAAEARAGRAAEKALKANDIQAAAVEKRAQLLNNRLSKAAADAVEEIRKGMSYLAKFDKESVRDKIDALLDRYDLRKSVSNAALDKREALQSFVERIAAMGYEPQIPEKLLNEAARVHYKDMAVEDFRGLVDAVKPIEHLGRLKDKLLDLQEKRTIAELAKEAADTTATLPQREPESNRGLTTMEANWLAVKAAGRSAQASLLKMEQMFDWLDARNTNGVFNRVVFRRIADAGVKEADLLGRVKADIDTLLHENLADVTKEKGTIYVAHGLIDGMTGQAQKFT